MKLVNDDEANSRQPAIALQSPQQNAVGDDLDFHPRPHAALCARCKAHPASNALAEQVCQPSCDGLDRNAARLQQHDALAKQPRQWGLQEQDWQARALACSRRCLQNACWSEAFNNLRVFFCVLQACISSR